MPVIASVDTAQIRADVCGALRAMAQRGLRSYQGYLIWQGGQWVERDIVATVDGYVRPTEHGKARCLRRPSDPDVIAAEEATEVVELLCRPVFEALDNVRIVARYRDNRATCSIDIPGQGSVE